MPVFTFAGMTMRRLVSRLGFAASATDGVPVVQVANLNDGHDSAVALAEPSRLTAFGHLKEFEDGQSTVSSSTDIFESRHDGSSYERLRLESARRFLGAPVRYSTTKCVA